jgi:pimeloyl-ACP methyl ester carboxylesterase
MSGSSRLLVLLAALCWSGFGLAQIPGDLTEEPVTIRTTDGLDLSGLITRPRATAPAVGVLLLHGSGATDMDETLPANMTSTRQVEYPFRDLAWRLAKEGFAVLRYNKRGVHKDPTQNDTGLITSASFTNLVEDARAVLKFFLGSQRGPRTVILLGHSEGTIIASILAAGCEAGIAGITCLSAPAHNLKEILHYQLVDRVLLWARGVVDENSDGVFTPAEMARHPNYHMKLSQLDLDGNGVVSYAELSAVLDSSWTSFLERRVPASPWLKEHFTIAPNLERFARLKMPVQIFHGVEDMQTPLSEAKLLESIRRRPELPTTYVEFFAGLGHGFSPALAFDKPTVGPMAQAVLDRIAQVLAATYRTAANEVAQR